MMRTRNDIGRDDERIVARYAEGYSLRECAAYFDKSIEGIRQALRRRAPHIIRPRAKGMGMSPSARLGRISTGSA